MPKAILTFPGELSAEEMDRVRERLRGWAGDPEQLWAVIGGRATITVFDDDWQVISSEMREDARRAPLTWLSLAMATTAVLASLIALWLVR